MGLVAGFRRRLSEKNVILHFGRAKTPFTNLEKAVVSGSLV